ncbi:hypothetical protein GQ55_2G415300 [Panicum hallii var. hallii]|uniref:Uncharacterized protein n=1 Tax=Panicum hallii var. hallii TaxID=1504633 RepID=A0A2T7EXY5_9POAL|nr:hypothetical protein GQ55_2G415300 [Panicum hallii var. hallii]
MASSSSDESYSEIVAQLSADHPEYLLDKQFELPEWLYSRKVNRVVWHDPSSVPDPKFPDLTEKGFWAKASSSAALKQACDDRNDNPALPERLADYPLTLFILPTTSPREVFDITALLPSEMRTPAIRIHNRVEQTTKLFARNVVQELLLDIGKARDNVAVDTLRLNTAIESKIKHREEMELQYYQADAAYKASPTPETNLEALAAVSRLDVARQVVEALLPARACVTALGESLRDKAAALEQAMESSTFMGCPVEEHPGGKWWIDGKGVMETAPVTGHGAGGDGFCPGGGG